MNWTDNLYITWILSLLNISFVKLSRYRVRSFVHRWVLRTNISNNAQPILRDRCSSSASLEMARRRDIRASCAHISMYSKVRYRNHSIWLQSSHNPRRNKKGGGLKPEGTHCQMVKSIDDMCKNLSVLLLGEYK